MSNGIDWRSVGVWGAFAGFQLGTVILDGWRRWRDRRVPTGYDKIVGGETVKGWRTAITGLALAKKAVAEGHYCFVGPTWTMDEIDEQFSLILCYRATRPDGRQIVNVAQHSLVCPDMVSMLFQIVIRPGDQYDLLRNCYSNSRTVACIFENIQSDSTGRPCLVVLMDKFSKRHCTLLLARPHQEAYTLTIWLENSMENRLNMLYFARDDSDELEHGVCRVELHRVRYQVPANDAEIGETGIQMRSWQSISFHWGIRTYYIVPASICVTNRPPLFSVVTIQPMFESSYSIGHWECGAW